MTDRFDKAARAMVNKAQRRAREDWGIDIAGLLRQTYNAALEDAAQIAQDVAQEAVDREQDDRETLGDMYNMSSYGAGHNAGECSAGRCIAEAAWELKVKP